MDDWRTIKQSGSGHYKSTVPDGVEVFDLLKDIKPHPDFSVLEVKALADSIKYAARMLRKGRNGSDCDKMLHLARVLSYMARPVDDKRDGDLKQPRSTLT